MHLVGLDVVSLRRAVPVVVSCGLHGLAVASTLAVTLLPPASEPRVLFAELTPLEASPSPSVKAPERTKPEPVTPPRLIRKPEPVRPLVSEPPPATAVAPAVAPPPVTPPPSEPRVDPSSPTEGLLPMPQVASESTQSRSPAPAAHGPDLGTVEGSVAASSGSSESRVGGERAVARVSPGAVDGVTQVARPQGGYQVRPTYPATARRVGAQGTTVLRVFVADDGRVMEILVQESAGHADLDRAAADAVARWRFEPARRGAQPVGMWVLLPVQFQLR